MQNLNKIGILNYNDVPVKTKSGQHIYTDIYLVDRARLVQCNIRDITDRKQAEIALRENEEKYRSLLDNASDAIFLADMEGYLLEANRKAEELLGYSKEEILGTHIFRIHPAEVFGKIKDTFNEIATKGSGSVNDVSILRKDGKIIPVDITGSLIERDGTKVLQGFFRDITERKHAEGKLRESEEKFRKVFYTSPDVVSINRLEDGMYISINPGFTRIMGYTEEDIIGKTSIECNIWDNVEDRQRLIVGLKKDEDVINLEAAFRTKGGEIRYGLVSGSVIDLNGVPHILGIVRDITDRKRVEEVLRESEEKYRAIIENMQEGYHEVDIKGNFTFFNESMRKIIGYEREELLGMNNRQYADEENTRKVYQRYNQVYRTGEPVKNFEWQIIRKDGDRRDIEVSISLTRDAEGHPIGFRGIVRDNTERRRAEDNLRQSEEQYRTLIETTQDLIYTTDRKGFLTYLNPTIERALGYTPNELKGASFAQIVAPDHIDRLRDFFRRSLKGESIPVYEVDLIRKDGTKLPVEFNVTTLFDKEGKPTGRYGIGRDITERKRVEEELKQSEDRYRSIFENTQEGIFRSIPEGRITMANPAMAKMFGYASPEEFMTSITDTARQIYVNPEERTKIKKIIEDQGSVRNYETQLRRKDGSTFWVSMTMQAVRDEKGQVLYYEGMDEDITERKESADRMRKALGATV
jgi:PAS domain S-box-containing protein